MGLRDWQEVIEDDFPDLPPVTKDTKQQMAEQSHRFRSSARIANAHVWEDEEYEEFRRKELATALP